MTSQLSRMVRGRRVAVIANNPRVRDYQADADVIVRFNSDPGSPADIWCTAFFGPFNQHLHDHCQLVIGSVPNCDAGFRKDGKDYRIDIDRYLPRIARPIEYVPLDRWCALHDAVGGVPLTGLVMLDLLAATCLEECVLIGFDFHRQPEHRAVRRDGVIGWTHPAVPSIRHLRRFLRSDRRFVMGERTRIFWPEMQWRCETLAWGLARAVVAGARRRLRRHGSA
jgi:hypothetical protein